MILADEQHRAACEARDVARRYLERGAEAVTAYLALVAKHRGQPAADALDELRSSEK